VTARTRSARPCGSTSTNSSPQRGEGISIADLPDHGRTRRRVRHAAVIIGLLAALTACDQQVDGTAGGISTTTITNTPATRLSKH
jgi:hypothetical protein